MDLKLILAFTVIILITWLAQALIAIAIHIKNNHRLPVNFKELILFTLAPYVIYSLIFNPKFFKK